MKKLLALAVAAAFTLPTFAITLETGDTVTSGSSTLYVTKIAQSAQSNAYDFNKGEDDDQNKDLDIFFKIHRCEITV